MLLSREEGAEEMALNKMGPPSACRCVCLFGLWRSDKEPEGKVILRL